MNAGKSKVMVGSSGGKLGFHQSGLVLLVDDNHFYVRQSFRVVINWKVNFFEI